MSDTPSDEPAAGFSVSRRTLLAGLGAASVGLPAMSDAAIPSPTHRDEVTLAVPRHAPASPMDAQKSYFEALHALQRAHARMLDVIVEEFQRYGRIHLSGAEGLLLVNIADGDRGAATLHSLHWGRHRRGSTAQLNNLAKRGYLTWTKRGRTITYALTEKGQAAADIATAGLVRHSADVHHLARVDAEHMATTSAALGRLQKFWEEVMIYGF